MEEGKEEGKSPVKEETGQDSNDGNMNIQEPVVKEKKPPVTPLDLELQRVMGTGLQYLSPEDVRSLLRQVWLRDSSVLAGILGVLKFNSSSHPTDIFFLTTIPVAPPVFRPVS